MPIVLMSQHSHIWEKWSFCFAVNLIRYSCNVTWYGDIWKILIGSIKIFKLLIMHNCITFSLCNFRNFSLSDISLSQASHYKIFSLRRTAINPPPHDAAAS